MSKENTSIKNTVIGGIIGALIGLLVVFFAGGKFLQDRKIPVKNSKNHAETLEEIFKDKEFITQEDLVIAAVEIAKPAVVSIIITKDVPIVERYYEDFGSSPLDDFFGPSFQIPQYREKGTEKKEVGGGSGFIVSEDGYIVTNKHVVDDEKAQYTVFLNDGSKHEAKVMAIDPLNDVAVLKIEKKDLPFLEFGDSESLKVGQSVIAIGNPLLEFENSVSVGVVSGLSRSIVAGTGFGKSEQLEGVIQTDAAINPGNSGGPLLNLKGKVIGMNVAVASGENIGFSLPASLVKQVVESVKENGRIIRPFLGVRYMPVTETLKESNKLSVDYGVLVVRGENPEDLAIIPGSPADKAGIVENDIILEIDGVKLDLEHSLARAVANKKVGDSLKLKILSKGKEKIVEVKLEELPK